MWDGVFAENDSCGVLTQSCVTRLLAEIVEGLALVVTAGLECQLPAAA